jgi:hypothetical protein
MAHPFQLVKRFVILAWGGYAAFAISSSTTFDYNSEEEHEPGKE